MSKYSYSVVDDNYKQPIKEAILNTQELVTIKVPASLRAQANYLTSVYRTNQIGVWERALECLAKKIKIKFEELDLVEITTENGKKKLKYLDPDITQ